MTRVDFYVLGAGATLDRERLVCRIAGKALSQGQRLHIHAASQRQADTIDELLWTFKDVSFLPHQQVREVYDPETPISIGCEGLPPGRAEVMINMAHPVPDFVSRYERVIEVVDQNPETRQRARERYRRYQDLGYPLDTHDITSFDG